MPDRDRNPSVLRTPEGRRRAKRTKRKAKKRLRKKARRVVWPLRKATKRRVNKKLRKKIKLKTMPTDFGIVGDKYIRKCGFIKISDILGMTPASIAEIFTSKATNFSQKGYSLVSTFITMDKIIFIGERPLTSLERRKARKMLPRGGKNMTAEQQRDMMVKLMKKFGVEATEPPDGSSSAFDRKIDI